MIALYLWACPAPDPHTPPADTDAPVVDTDAPVVDTDAAPTPCAAGVAAHIGPAAFADLQAALDATAPGDTVDVCPGAYGALYTITADGDLTLRSFTDDPTDVVFDPQGLHGSLFVDGSDLRLTLRALTFRNGFAGEFLPPTWGRGGAASLSADHRLATTALTVERCAFHDSVSWHMGSALYADGFATVTLSDLTVAGNRSDSGAAITLDRVLNAVTVSRSTFTANEGGATGALGIYRATASPADFEVLLEDSAFTANVGTSGARGSAVHLSSDGPGTTHLRVRASSFTHNVEIPDVSRNVSLSGALYLGNTSGRGTLEADIEDSSFDGNVGDGASHLRFDHANDTTTGQLRIARSTFTGGASTGVYDAEDYFGEFGAAIHASYPLIPGRPPRSDVTLTDVTFGPSPYPAFPRCTATYTGSLSGVVRPYDAVWCP